MTPGRDGPAPPARRTSLAAAACLAAALCFPAAAGGPVEEPLGYRMDHYRAPVPGTLEDATVVDTRAAHALWQAGEAVFVDVLPRAPKPANLPEGTIWRETPRRSIPGAIWLPNVGYGAIAPETDAYFRAGLEAAGATPETPVVFFCLADCWMSWNAARRAMWDYGFEHVHWFPGGTDTWAEAGHPLETVERFAR